MKNKASCGASMGMVNYVLLFILVTVLTFATSNQAYGYKKHRKSSIQDDLNKLYDNQPTLSSNVEEHSSKFHRTSSSKHRGGDTLNRFLSDIGTQDDKEIASSPFFDLDNSGNVTAVLGKKAYLNCRVKHIKNQTVSWLRHKDTHLLTIGRLTYTSDLRFRAIHKMYSEDWMLEIKPTTHRDSGRYECQISTTPPTSHIVYLKIAEPKTAILGGPDIHLKEGSTMNLTCVITDSPEPPSYIFWRHDDTIISYDSPRGGVSVITEKGDVTASFLVVQLARPSDAGIYSCSPSIGEAVSVNVHVLRGEYKLGLGTNSAANLQPTLTLLSTKYITHIFTVLQTSFSVLIPSSLCIPIFKSSMSYVSCLSAYILFSVMLSSFVAHVTQRTNHKSIAINQQRIKQDTKQDKISPVMALERQCTCIAAPKTVINSDVKLQEDTLTAVTGGTREQNTMAKQSKNINAHIDSHSNNKYTKW